ncbi:MAG: hypothetical protein JHC84_19000 [Solirubrobacteraceae bacterium]|nr:hypothetical protein [Solirubrobacteraceae bacterium]
MDREPLEGIGAADAHLGRRVPLPRVPLPLARWVDVMALGTYAVEIAWNLDDTRNGDPGRLALYVGSGPPPERALGDPVALGRYAHRTAPLEDADSSLRPVHELSWADDGLYLRLTGQGPWALDALVTIADSVRPGEPG